MDAHLSKTLITNVRICQQDTIVNGSVLFEQGGKILQIIPAGISAQDIEADEIIDGHGNLLLPGAIDDLICLNILYCFLCRNDLQNLAPLLEEDRSIDYSILLTDTDVGYQSFG